MLIAPLKISLERLDQLLHPNGLVITLPQEHPLRLRHHPRNRPHGRVAVDDRDDPLVQRDRLLQLLETMLGGKRPRADDEDERLARLDPTLPTKSTARSPTRGSE